MANYTLKETEFAGIPILEVCYNKDYSKLELNVKPFNRIVVHHPGSKDYSLGDLISLHMGKPGFGTKQYLRQICDLPEINRKFVCQRHYF